MMLPPVYTKADLHFSGFQTVQFFMITTKFQEILATTKPALGKKNFWLPVFEIPVANKNENVIVSYKPVPPSCSTYPSVWIAFQVSYLGTFTDVHLNPANAQHFLIECVKRVGALLFPKNSRAVNSFVNTLTVSVEDDNVSMETVTVQTLTPGSPLIGVGMDLDFMGLSSPLALSLHVRDNDPTLSKVHVAAL